MKKGKKYIIFFIVVIFIAVLLIIFKSTKTYNENVLANGSIIFTTSQNLSNKKIGWGIKRGINHNQPSFGDENKRLLNAVDGIYMGNSEKKYVYLTFDEGYEAGYTEKILDVLKENDVKATFFITAHYLNSQLELVKRMIVEGHIVGNHTVNHHSMPDLNDEKLKQEIMKLHTTVFDLTSYEMGYFRPPKGEYSERTLEITKALGYTTAMWSLAYDDWDEKKQGRAEYGKAKILDNIHNGAVILLHATSKDNADILDECIKEIKKRGYEFKNLDQFEK